MIFSRVLAAGAALALLPAAPPAAAETGTVEEIVAILKDKGLIDEGQEQQLLDRHHREQAAAPSVGAKIMEGMEWSGDLRLRHESFWFDAPADGLSRSKKDRYRWRYRARFGFEKQVNEWARVGVRLASGGGENDSTNRTLGTEVIGSAGTPDDLDFADDPLYIDRAWAELQFETGGLKSKLVGGKVGNPFVWKNGKDILIWDHDIELEGAYLGGSTNLSENAKLFGTFGAFVVEERSSDSDGMVYAGQLGGTAKLSDTLEIGGRSTLYLWRNLDMGQTGRALSDGNLAGAFDTDKNGNSDTKIGEVAAFLKLGASEDWPMTFYGSYAKNFEADSIGLIDDEDRAYSYGFEIGSSKRFAELGVGFFYAEANSLVATFIDSNVLDSHTNRKGWAIYGSRKLGDGVELKLTYFDSDEISSTASTSPNLNGADRQRLQSDLVFKF